MKRDKYDIIIQTNEDPNYEDGGDSAFSTGIMAFCGSVRDKKLMPKFIKDRKVVRHPEQLMWANAELTSRDQIKAFFAGIYPDKGSAQLGLVDSCFFYAESWFVNADILMPADKFYLYKCTGVVDPPFWLYPLAYVNQALNLFWDCFVKPNNEMNQAVCTNIIFGTRWIKFLYWFHPNLLKNVSDYFSGWRNKEEIGVALNKKILDAISK